MLEATPAEFRSGIERVAKLYNAYKSSGGNFLLHGPNWSPNYWESVAEATNPALFVWQDAWGERRVTRELIQKLWAEVVSEFDAAQALTFTMIWGFGAVRYGRTNLTKILSFKGGDVEKIGLYLLEKHTQAQIKPLAAFEDILRNGPKALGPVYASKLLYAMTPLHCRTPVIDRWVSAWFRTRCQIDIKATQRQFVTSNVQTLKRLQDFCNASLDELQKNDVLAHSRDVGLIEYLVFWDAQPVISRKKAPNWMQVVD